MVTELTPPGNSAVKVPVTKTGAVGVGGWGGWGERSLSTSSVLVLTVDTVVGEGVGRLLVPISKKEVGVETILLELKGDGVTGGLSR